MAEYMTAFEMEIAAEGFIDTIKEKGAKIIKIFGDLIQKAIKFITGLIAKLRRNKVATNMDPTPNSQYGGKSEVMTGSKIVTISNTDIYDCGKELNDVVADLNLCVEMIVKRGTLNHKINKSYGERWAQDDAFINERMMNCNNILVKLKDIEYKTINLELAESLKNKLEALNDQYNKYGAMYKNFNLKHPEANKFMMASYNSLGAISDVGCNALQAIMTLMTPKDE